jgi:hypothetical protein
MSEARFAPVKETGKALLMLVVLGITAQWAASLSSLLVVVVMLRYAAYAWQAIAGTPSDELHGLLAVAGCALLLGFATSLGYGALTVMGLSLVIAVPLWRTASSANRADEAPEVTQDGEPS